MRDTRLTLWPEQKSYYPLVNSWAEIKNTEILDLSACTGVHSCGLAATLLNIHSLYISLRHHSGFKDDQLLLPGLCPDRKINKIIINKHTSINEDCLKLNFFTHLFEHFAPSLQEKYPHQCHFDLIESEYFLCKTFSFPVLRFNFNKTTFDRRDALDTTFDYIEQCFAKLGEKKNFNASQLEAILYEIAKNSADHTTQDGFIGLDFSFYKEIMNISILIGDLGPGIYSHMRKHYIKENPTRTKKTGFAEIYRHALTNEITTKKGSGKNSGIGMSFIINNAISLDAKLSVFDAKSRIMLTSLKPIIDEGPPHNEMWRCSLRMDGKKPFFYYIELEVVR